MEKSQPWTPLEDQMLLQLYEKVDCFQRWKFISKKFQEKGLHKTQFQCRQRFINHVDPSIKHGRLSNSEIIKLFKCYDERGPHWSDFEQKMPGRPQSLLKNKFYSTLRSLVRHFVKAGQKRNLNIANIQFHKISTKLLANLYDGKGNFISCRNVLKNVLRNIDYSIESAYMEKYLNSMTDKQIECILKKISESIDGKKEKNNKDEKINNSNKILEQQNNICNEVQNHENRLKKQENEHIFIQNPFKDNRNHQEYYQTFVIYPIQALHWPLIGSTRPLLNYFNQ